MKYTKMVKSVLIGVLTFILTFPPFVFKNTLVSAGQPSVAGYQFPDVTIKGDKQKRKALIDRVLTYFFSGTVALVGGKEVIDRDHEKGAKLLKDIGYDMYLLYMGIDNYFKVHGEHASLKFKFKKLPNMSQAVAVEQKNVQFANMLRSMFDISLVHARSQESPDELQERSFEEWLNDPMIDDSNSTPIRGFGGDSWGDFMIRPLSFEEFMDGFLTPDEAADLFKADHVLIDWGHVRKYDFSGGTTQVADGSLPSPPPEPPEMWEVSTQDESEEEPVEVVFELDGWLSGDITICDCSYYKQMHGMAAFFDATGGLCLIGGADTTDTENTKIFVGLGFSCTLTGSGLAFP